MKRVQRLVCVFVVLLALCATGQRPSSAQGTVSPSPSPSASPPPTETPRPTQPPGCIDIVKKVEPPDPSAPTFSFSGSLGSFGLSANGAVKKCDLPFGPYTVTENPTAPWFVSNIMCNGGSNVFIGSNHVFDPGDVSVTIHLPPGGSISCIFTNSKKGPLGSPVIGPSPKHLASIPPATSIPVSKACTKTNLVQNPSFEQAAPVSASGESIIRDSSATTEVPFWTSSAVYSSQGKVLSPTQAVPNNAYGNQAAFDGSRYGVMPPVINTVPRVFGKLTTPTIGGRLYKLSAHVSLSDKSTSGVQVALELRNSSSGSSTNAGSVPVTDKTNWQLVSRVIGPSVGGEDQIMVQIFSSPNASLYVDAVSVCEIKKSWWSPLKLAGLGGIAVLLALGAGVFRSRRRRGGSV